MNLTSLIRTLESELKKAENLTSYYDIQADALRRKLTHVSHAVGKSFGMTKASGTRKRRAGRTRNKGRTSPSDAINRKNTKIVELSKYARERGNSCNK